MKKKKNRLIIINKSTTVLVKSEYLATVLSNIYVTNSESMNRIGQSAKLEKFKEGNETILSIPQ